MNTLRRYIRAALVTEMGQIEKGAVSAKRFVEVLKGSTLIFFDTETTGLDPRRSHVMVTQASAMAVDGATGEVLGTFDERARISPAVRDRIAKEEERTAAGEWPEGRLKVSDILKMTGHDPEGVGYKAEDELLAGLSSFVEEQRAGGKDLILVAHNARFDMYQINSALQRHGLPKISTKEPTKVLDTLALTRGYLKPALERLASSGNPEATEKLGAMKVGKKFSSTLSSVGKAFGVGSKGWHTAAADVEQLKGILDKVVEFFGTHGEAIDVR